LFRKAAELYDPEALAMVAHVYELIGESELKMNRPVAARAALQIALRCKPDQEQANAFETIFGDQSRYPLAARREYTFQSPPPREPGNRRQAWDRALHLAGTPRLREVLHAFDQLTTEDPEDAAAWYNRALVQAWLGDNKAALESLDQYVAREPDESRAAAD